MEVNDLLTFYQSKLGQRVIENTPRLMKTAMVLGQQWGMQLAGSVMVDLARQPPQAAPSVSTDSSTYTMNKVDEPVLIVNEPEPRYPKALKDSLITARIALRYIVDATGHAEPNSFQVLEHVETNTSGNHESFVEAAKETIRKSTFKPARFQGRPVRQLVEQRILFNIRP